MGTWEDYTFQSVVQGKLGLMNWGITSSVIYEGKSR